MTWHQNNEEGIPRFHANSEVSRYNFIYFFLGALNFHPKTQKVAYGYSIEARESSTVDAVSSNDWRMTYQVPGKHSHLISREIQRGTSYSRNALLRHILSPSTCTS